ncbi:MAG: hypothetical protein NTY09_11175 [bacterium]|nr:hypothetical protein [bacterium]
MRLKSFRKILLVLSTFALMALLTAASPPAIPDMASGCDLIGHVQTGYINSGESVTFTFDLEPGAYTFAAWASWDLTSLKLSVSRPDGVELTYDDGTDNNPIVGISFTELTTVNVILTGGIDRVHAVAGAYSFVAATGEGCYEKSVDPAKEILEDYTAVAAENSEEVVKWEYRQLSGENSLILNYTLDPGDYTIVAETLNAGDDIDMYVRKGEEVLNQDEYPDNRPECIINLLEQTVVSIEIDPWVYGNGTDTSVVVIVTMTMTDKRE